MAAWLITSNAFVYLKAVDSICRFCALRILTTVQRFPSLAIGEHQKLPFFLQVNSPVSANAKVVGRDIYFMNRKRHIFGIECRKSALAGDNGAISLIILSSKMIRTLPG